MKNPNTTTYDQPTYPETMRERVAHLEAERDTLQAENTRLRDTCCVATLIAGDVDTRLVTLRIPFSEFEAGRVVTGELYQFCHLNLPKENKQ